MVTTSLTKNKSTTVLDAIVRDILSGRYPDGQLMPTEATLCETYDVSRVTIRRALDELKARHVITSVRGSGTRVSLQCQAQPGDLEVVVVAAPVYEPFFASFFGRFQATCDAHGTSVMFKQETETSDMSSPGFYLPLIERGIRDFVLWPERGYANLELLPRLRGIGSNLVFFDHGLESPYADSVTLDNRHAVETLVDALLARQCSSQHFLSWDDVPLSSVAEREGAFLARDIPDKAMTRVARQGEAGDPLRRLFGTLRRRRQPPDALVCVSHDMGIRVCNLLRELGNWRPVIAVVDEMPPIADFEVISVAQPLDELARRTYECLQRQNCIKPNRARRKRNNTWSAARHQLRGTLCT